jgi:dihydrofolate reductase
MRKIRIFEHMSLDGVISPGGPNEDSEYAHGGWTAPYRSAAGAEAVAEAQGKGFDLLLGRRTYDLWAGFWPKVKGGPFADSLNAATKYVATHRPDIKDLLLIPQGLAANRNMKSTRDSTPLPATSQRGRSCATT